jgi:hypothetical protein
MGRYKEAVTEFGIGYACVIVRLVVEIPIGLRSDFVTAAAHRVFVFFNRSSNRRCFSSQ